MGGLLNAVPTAWVRFSEDGVEVLSPVKVTLQAPTIELKGDVVQTGGDVSMSGTATVAVDVIGGGISLKNHTHGGVTTGGGNTAPPNP
jgi:phage baseplate assembly protein gpV